MTTEPPAGAPELSEMEIRRLALLQHTDARTREDATRALDAIHHQNHHYFVDRAHSGRSFWVVNETDKRPGQ
jgi:hypothetical protein